jgi:hypothetical protein
MLLCLPFTRGCPISLLLEHGYPEDKERRSRDAAESSLADSAVAEVASEFEEDVGGPDENGGEEGEIGKDVKACGSRSPAWVVDTYYV